MHRNVAMSKQWPRSTCVCVGYGDMIKLKGLFWQLWILSNQLIRRQVSVAGQLNIKLLVTSIYNLKVLLICFILFCLFPDSCNFLALGSILKTVVLQEKVSCRLHVVISILQAFNCLYLEIFVHDLYFFSLYFTAKT